MAWRSRRSRTAMARTRGCASSSRSRSDTIWNRNYIDHIEITAAESIGIEGRGPFYESAGALRDVMQNHVMELLSFVAMEPPVSFAADAVRAEKIKVYRAIKPIHFADTVRGPY